MGPKLEAEFEERNALFQVKLLAQRVDTLVREKERLEADARDDRKRISRIENALAMGWGVLIVLPILGAVLGFVFANRAVIFGPWLRAL